MPAVITALGTANPPHRQQQSITAEIISRILCANTLQKRLIKSIYKATGIDYRHSVLSDFAKPLGEFEIFPNDVDAPFPSTKIRMKLYQEHARPLALAAINNCLRQLKNFNRQSITHLITVSCTGMYAPGLDIEIVHALQLSAQVERTAIQFMGCYAAFNALKVADAIAKSNPQAKILVVCVELCTLHFQNKMDPDNLIANAIFADGAAAALIEGTPMTHQYLQLQAFHCDLLPQAKNQMAWHIGDHGFDMVLSSYVSQTIALGIQQFVQHLLLAQHIKLSDIDFYAIHPGGSKILEACEIALALSPDDNKYAYQVLKNYGNMSSATILFVLKAIWDELSAADHDKTIFSCAFGPGLTLESMLLRAHCPS